MNIQTFIDIDRTVLSWFNGSDSLFLDQLVCGLTSPWTWIPLYLALIWLAIKNSETTQQMLLVFGIAVLCLLLSDGMADGIVKPLVRRWRPLYDPVVGHTVDVVPGVVETRYGFFSAHASNTFSIALYLILIVRNRAFTLTLLAWSLINCYTRLYLGVHYPGDVLAGLCWGAVVGTGCWLLYRYLSRKFSPEIRYVSSQYTSTGYGLADIRVVVQVFTIVLAYAVIRAVVM
ncbi:MAG: phosphatase PAP2 family protein [Prevotella sp.]|nr:phosphatase PAP2 family protein [Prevotella sp.]